MRIFRNAEVRLRDGVRIFVDVYRPSGTSRGQNIPAILGWSPYGKHNTRDHLVWPEADVGPGLDIAAHRLRSAGPGILVRTGIRGGLSGSARLLVLRRRAASRRPGRGRGLLRPDRVAGTAVLVQRPRRHVRRVLPHRHPVAGGGAAPDRPSQPSIPGRDSRTGTANSRCTAAYPKPPSCRAAAPTCNGPPRAPRTRPPMSPRIRCTTPTGAARRSRWSRSRAPAWVVASWADQGLHSTRHARRLPADRFAAEMAEGARPQEVALLLPAGQPRATVRVLLALPATGRQGRPAWPRVRIEVRERANVGDMRDETAWPLADTRLRAAAPRSRRSGRQDCSA